MSLSAFAPAKVNLFLHVGAPSDDGYHPLASLMVFADVGDVVAIQPSEAPGFEVTGPFAFEGDNLVVRAAEALLSRIRGPRPPFRLILDKRLPVAAGLGGGSADAGAALRLLREALGLSVDDAALEEIAASLGADGAACLWGEAVVAQGRGQRLSAAPQMPPLDAVLVNPLVPSPTGAVYTAYDKSGSADLPPMPEAFESAEEVAAWLAYCRNDLQVPAVAREPLIGEVLETLAGEPETLLARMSGSGATCFALCAGDIEAEGLAERLQAMRPGWWVRRCRLS